MLDTNKALSNYLTLYIMQMLAFYFNNFIIVAVSEGSRVPRAASGESLKGPRRINAGEYDTKGAVTQD